MKRGGGCCRPCCGPQPPPPPVFDDVWMDDDMWRSKLTSRQYLVLRKGGTEMPFSGAYHDFTADGTYGCVGCENTLFESNKQYNSGRGWPSFYEALPGSVVEIEHPSCLPFLRHTEVVCGRCGCHVGEIYFGNGGPPDNKRYSINSCAISFVPAVIVEDMEAVTRQRTPGPRGSRARTRQANVSPRSVAARRLQQRARQTFEDIYGNLKLSGEGTTYAEATAAALAAGGVSVDTLRALADDVDPTWEATSDDDPDFDHPHRGHSTATGRRSPAAVPRALRGRIAAGQGEDSGCSREEEDSDAHAEGTCSSEGGGGVGNPVRMRSLGRRAGRDRPRAGPVRPGAKGPPRGPPLLPPLPTARLDNRTRASASGSGDVPTEGARARSVAEFPRRSPSAGTVAPSVPTLPLLPARTPLSSSQPAAAQPKRRRSSVPALIGAMFPSRDVVPLDASVLPATVAATVNDEVLLSNEELLTVDVAQGTIAPPAATQLSPVVEESAPTSPLTTVSSAPLSPLPASLDGLGPPSPDGPRGDAAAPAVLADEGGHHISLSELDFSALRPLLKDAQVSRS